MCQRAATMSSSVNGDASVYHSVKFVTEIMTVTMAATKPTAVRSTHGYI